MTKIINPHEILETANGFYHLAISCGFQEGRILSPQFVNLALACELYLKAVLLKTTGTYPRGRSGHLLQELYNALDDAAKSGIRDELRKAQAKSEETTLLVLEERRGVPYERAVPSLADEAIENNVKNTIREASDLFTKWRYIFEIDNPFFLRSGFFHDLTIALKVYATSIVMC